MPWVVGSVIGVDPALLNAVEYAPRLPTEMVCGFPRSAPEPTVVPTVDESETEEVSRLRSQCALERTDGLLKSRKYRVQTLKIGLRRGEAGQSGSLVRRPSGSRRIRNGSE